MEQDTVEIEIVNDDPSKTRGLKIWSDERLIARDVDEGDLETLLTPEQLARYEAGEYRFLISAFGLDLAFGWRDPSNGPKNWKPQDEVTI